MTLLSLLWVPVTLIAALAQTARNATQRSLTAAIGVVGATQARFLYGFPFALLFLLLVLVWHGRLPAWPGQGYFLYVLAAALAQIIATALMLAAMRDKSFALVTAYTKTEPVQVALFGAIMLGDHLGPWKLGAILVATSGVVLTSLKPGQGWRQGGGAALVLGLSAGAAFALAAVFFRGAILSLPPGDGFVLRATLTLVFGLGMQSAILMVWMLAFDRGALIGSLRAWRPSLKAGFLGAFASQFWFLGFALTTAANVRTLALVEVLMAQIVSRRLFSETMSRIEKLGLVLIVLGVGALLWGAL